MPSCNTCKRDIVAPNPIATYEEKTYHPECLKCNACKKSVSGKRFLKEKTGNLICEDCNAKVSPKCTKCGLIFGPGQSYKKLSESIFFHNECFKCSGPCQAQIVGEFYDLEDGHYLCTECYDKHGVNCVQGDVYNAPPPPVPSQDSPVNKLASTLAGVNLSKNNKNGKVEVLPAVERDPKPKADMFICAKCNLRIDGQYTVFNEKKYHTKCFVCCQCNQEFKEKSLFKKDDKPLCRECHNKNLVSQASKCFKCTQPILDTVVTFKNNEYHDYCLICNSCSKKLAGQSIYLDKSDKPMCSDCFTKKEAKSCAKCNKKIAPNQTSLVFEDKNYHKECFTCQQCSKTISADEQFYKSDDGKGVICNSCVN